MLNSDSPECGEAKRRPVRAPEDPYPGGPGGKPLFSHWAAAVGFMGCLDVAVATLTVSHSFGDTAQRELRPFTPKPAPLHGA